MLIVIAFGVISDLGYAWALASSVMTSSEVSRGVVLDTASEGPHSLFVLFVQIETLFVQIVTKN